MKIKKIMVALLITSFMLTQSLQVNAYNNMNYSVQSMIICNELHHQ